MSENKSKKFSFQEMLADECKTVSGGCFGFKICNKSICYVKVCRKTVRRIVDEAGKIIIKKALEEK